ncbi:MAG TPA: nucleoid occlusion protein [Bacillales bacterium]|nr:nucleoid occlusion protein [Bacillales bacterium]
MKRPISKLFKTDKGEEPEEHQNEQVHEIPVNRIVPNRFQPRTVFNDEKIDELSQTIQSHGMIQPIVLRKWEDKYEIIAGERRWRAVTKLGWKLVPAIIKDYDDSKTASVALIENLQREELTSIEEAMAYARLIDIHGLTQESLAQRLGKGQSTIANKLRLLKLPGVVQQALLEREISERHARALISVKNHEQQEKLLHEVIDKQWNVKQLEERIERLNQEPKKKKPRRKAFSKDTRLALNTIRQSIDMVSDSGLNIDTEEREDDHCFEITIRIPKSK